MIGICGASGYIGRSLFERLKLKGERVLGTYCHNEVEDMFRFDLRRGSLKFFDGCSFVVILSAYAKIQYCEQNKIEAFWLNVYRTRQLLDRLRKRGIPALFMSSDAATRYDTVYGQYKRQVEKYIDRNNLPAMYLRPGKINEGNITLLCEVIYAHIKSWRGQEVKS